MDNEQWPPYAIHSEEDEEFYVFSDEASIQKFLLEEASSLTGLHVFGNWWNWVQDAGSWLQEQLGWRVIDNP